MRITIDISAANDPDAHQWLDRILHRIEDGWHVWDLTDTPDADAIEATTWVSDPGRQGSRLRELLVASTRRSAWTLAPHTRCLRVTAHPAAPDELAPEQACRLADEPLVILVENRDSDGAFVGRVVTELDKSLHGVWRREGEPIRFDSVGGADQMPREVESRTGAVRIARGSSPSSTATERVRGTRRARTPGGSARPAIGTDFPAGCSPSAKRKTTCPECSSAKGPALAPCTRGWLRHGRDSAMLRRTSST